MAREHITLMKLNKICVIADSFDTQNKRSIIFSSTLCVRLNGLLTASKIPLINHMDGVLQLQGHVRDNQKPWEDQ